MPIKILYWGFIISFLGSLPLGTLNVLATQISVQSGIYTALLFSTGAVLIEVIYVRLALTAMDKIVSYPIVFRCLEWLSAAILLLLGIAFFVTAKQAGGISKILPATFSDAFWLGVLLSATSPMHITFWFGWSTVLMEKQILIAGKNNYSLYITGIGVGSLLGYAVFVVGGSYLINLLSENQQWLNRIIGGVLLFTGLLQSFKIICKYQTTPA